MSKHFRLVTYLPGMTMALLMLIPDALPGEEISWPKQYVSSLKQGEYAAFTYRYDRGISYYFNFLMYDGKLQGSVYTVDKAGKRSEKIHKNMTATEVALLNELFDWFPGAGVWDGKSPAQKIEEYWVSGSRYTQTSRLVQYVDKDAPRGSAHPSGLYLLFQRHKDHGPAE